MAIRVRSLNTHKVDVRYHFSDGSKLIHDSKRYYIGSVKPENQVHIESRGEEIVYKFVDRGEEPPTTLYDESYYTHPYGGRTIMPKTGLPAVGWSITDGRTTTYGAGTSLAYTAASRGLSRGQIISLSAACTQISLGTNPDWTDWDSKGTGSHTKEPEKTKDFIRKEKKSRRR